MCNCIGERRIDRARRDMSSEEFCNLVATTYYPTMTQGYTLAVCRNRHLENLPPNVADPNSIYQHLERRFSGREGEVNRAETS